MVQNKQIKDFWEKSGLAKPAGELVTHGDIEQVAIEIDSVLSLLNKNDVLMDIGCGSGFSTSIYADKCKKVLGIDYAETMIDSAKNGYQANNLSFEQQNVLSLDRDYGLFSVIVSTRCLINLNSWDEQKEAIQKIHECLETKGRLILIEGTLQGRKALNSLRSAVGLDPMPPVWHNIDFDEELLFPFLSELFEIKSDIRFGVYDLLMRVNYPLSIAPDSPQYGSPFHRAAHTLAQAVGEDPFPQYCREFILELVKK